MDRHTRRKLLSILGTGALGSLAGCGGFVEIRTARRGDTAAETETETVTATDTDGDYLSAELGRVETTNPIDRYTGSFTFAAEPQTVEVSSATFGIDELRTVPSDSQNGDTLEIRSTEKPTSELITQFQLLWGIDDEQARQEITIDGEQTELRGGAGLEFAALLGTHPVNDSEIIAVRAESVQEAKTVARSYAD